MSAPCTGHAAESDEWMASILERLHYHACDKNNTAFSRSTMFEAADYIRRGAQRDSSADGCAVLPDGSAFTVVSFPLPPDHWLYAPCDEWDEARDEYAECPEPILTISHRATVTAAARYAIRVSTMRGQETDFDPDALVLNICYALCGPAGSAAQRDHIGDGPDHKDGPDADGFSGPRPWNSYGNAPQSVELPESDTSDIAGYTPHALRTYGDAREAAGYARGQSHSLAGILREALEQVLDDMGEHGLSVCPATKEHVIAALRGEVK